jgi:hypothetical protein
VAVSVDLTITEAAGAETRKLQRHFGRLAPGAGMAWFGSSFAPSGWAHSERVTYLATELVPVLVFVEIGVLFWVLGKKTRSEIASLEASLSDSTCVSLGEGTSDG